MDPVAGKPLSEIMTTDLVFMEPGDSLRDALSVMREKKISSLVVCVSKMPVGIVTEHDIVHAASTGICVDDTRIGDLMTSPVATLNAGTDIQAGYRMMSSRGFRHLVVVDVDGRFCGIVSETDFIAHLGIDFFANLIDIESATSTDYVLAAPGDSLDKKLAEMDERHHTCIIVEDGGKPVGIVTERDSVKFMLDGRDMARVPIEEVMSTPLHTVGEGSNIYDAANSMIARGTRHLVVVDGNGRTKGTLSVHEVVRGLGGRYLEHLEEVVRVKEAAARAAQMSEQQLQKEHERLVHATMDLERFSFAASHHLQEPVRIIMNHAQILERSLGPTLDGNGREVLGTIMESAQRMRAMVNGLSGYYRTSSIDFESTFVNMNDVFARVITGLQDALIDSGADVDYDPLPTVFGDPEQVRTLLHNLLDNAVKFRRAETPPEIHLSVEDNGDSWLFQMQDNGIGIEPDYLEQIFHVFVCLHPVGAYSGTGLGLALCRKIVDGHGGWISALSELGRGTAIRFTLPKGPGDAQEG